MDILTRQLHRLRLVRKPQCLHRQFGCRRYYLAGSESLFTEGDFVLLRRNNRPDHKPRLVQLRAGSVLETHHGNLPHSEIIGRRIRDTIRTNKGVRFRVHTPTLAEYVCATRRLVAPVYPADASAIVSLLDIHATPAADPSAECARPLEILEAGTGHGSLTLHLACAIHAANPPLPENTAAAEAGPGEEEAALAPWKRRRRAVVRTVEAIAKNSEHARTVVRNFRRGMYVGDVDFYVGDLSEYVSSRLAASDGPFAAHAILDLPSPQAHLRRVAEALHLDGLLVVFAPSVTQISDCAKYILDEKLPFAMDRVIELGSSMGLREWDIRLTTPKRAERKRVGEKGVEGGEVKLVTGAEDESERPPEHEVVPSAELNKSDGDGITNGEATEGIVDGAKDAEKYMVCRPKVGKLIVGGGFLGLWRRRHDRPSFEDD